MVYFDLNLHENDTAKQFVANRLYFSLLNAKKLSRIFYEYYQEHDNDTIFFMIRYANIHVSYTTGDRVDVATGKVVQNYFANVSYDLIFIDALHSIEVSRSMEERWNSHSPSFGSKESALEHSVNKIISKQVTQFVSEYFQ